MLENIAQNMLALCQPTVEDPLCCFGRFHIFATLKEKVSQQNLLLLLPNLHFLKLNATPQKTLTTHGGIQDADLSMKDPDDLSLDRDELSHSGADVAVANFANSLTTTDIWTKDTSAHGTTSICNGHQRTK